MAATIGRVQGFGRNGPQASEATRLGHQFTIAHADTYRTFTTAHVNKDGSGYIEVTRDGVCLHTFKFGPETED